ncbi:Crp/Fnr family transcriptional regulator [Sporosarcina obsidiansis]|uniref:Crp/Fnr family transcriptional regulator n=1 Tax=Sporosarcina obsidiansis TaxID=2660748 RepID=UPI001890F753|nr:Crp/Fnr family transcriptional regulator [Sporosarcina obsidiansis]
MLEKKDIWEHFISTGYGQSKNYKKNTILFRQGDIGQGFYYLSEGEVKISLLSPQGNERDIDYVIPGFLLGEQGIYNNSYFTSASITMPSTLHFFSKEDFTNICLEIPEAASIFTNSLITKVRLLAEATTILNAPAEYRLAHFIYRLYKRSNETTLKISQVSLARFIGTSRITVYKIMNQWKCEKMIDYDKGTIYLLDITKFLNYLNQALYSHNIVSS